MSNGTEDMAVYTDRGATINVTRLHRATPPLNGTFDVEIYGSRVEGSSHRHNACFSALQWPKTSEFQHACCCLVLTGHNYYGLNGGNEIITQLLLTWSDYQLLENSYTGPNLDLLCFARGKTILTECWEIPLSKSTVKCQTLLIMFMSTAVRIKC